MKPGIKTTEFILTLVATVLIALGTIPPGARFPVVLSVVGYALARGLAKFGAPGPPL